MQLSLQKLVTERAQPRLGTLVSIRVEEMADVEAHHAIDAAFEEIATVHRLMSFHDAASDVSRLNRSCEQPVAVHPYTFEVLDAALKFAASSDGCFDISVGAELVEWGLLPRPADAARAPEGSWRDIELRNDGRVMFHRPLWIDLGGIAKGYAVDRATERLRTFGALQTVVNAGGDIRVQGRAEPIRLSAETATETMPVLELTDGSVASSSGHLLRRWIDGEMRGPHVHGARRSAAPTDRFVCVTAERCMVADALTKVVMAEGAESGGVLREFGASGYLYDPKVGWRWL